MSYKCSTSVKVMYVISLMAEGFRDQMEITGKVSVRPTLCPWSLICLLYYSLALVEFSVFTYAILS